VQGEAKVGFEMRDLGSDRFGVSGQEDARGYYVVIRRCAHSTCSPIAASVSWIHR